MRVDRLVRSIASGAVLVASLAFVPMPTAGATDAYAPLAPLQVVLNPIEPSGPKGLAILAAAEAATAVQVLATGAPDGAIATIQPGTCDALGSDVVGLVGELSATGQAQATIPVPMSSLTDGSHVVALHPGLDFTSTLACGAIPLVAALPPAPEPDPEPEPAPDPPEPVVDADCEGVPGWLTATRSWLDELTAGESELRRLTADPAGYAAALGEQIGRVNVMITEMQQAPVPPAAASTHQQLVGAVESGIVAARQLIESYQTGDPTLYQQAVRTATAANAEIAQVRISVGELEARCVPDPPG